MAKKNVVPGLVFAVEHTRNAYDMKYVLDPETGRHVLTADKEGVKKRIGLLVTFLANNPSGKTKEECAQYLRDNFHTSYHKNDVSQSFRQMSKGGIIEQLGIGWDTKYVLASKGKDIWEKVRKNSVWR